MITYKQYLNETEYEGELAAIFDRMLSTIVESDLDVNWDMYRDTAAEQLGDGNYDEDDIEELCYSQYEENSVQALFEKYVQIDENASKLTPQEKWVLIKYDPEMIKDLEKPEKDIQEYVIQTRPDLASKIQNPDPELKKKYKHEFSLSGIDV